MPTINLAVKVIGYYTEETSGKVIVNCLADPPQPPYSQSLFTAAFDATEFPANMQPVPAATLIQNRLIQKYGGTFDVAVNQGRGITAINQLIGSNNGNLTVSVTF